MELIEEPKKRRGRPPLIAPIYKNLEALKAYKNALYDKRGYLISRIRKLAAKNGADIEYARKSPEILIEILKA